MTSETKQQQIKELDEARAFIDAWTPYVDYEWSAGSSETDNDNFGIVLESLKPDPERFGQILNLAKWGRCNAILNTGSFRKQK